MHRRVTVHSLHKIDAGEIFEVAEEHLRGVIFGDLGLQGPCQWFVPPSFEISAPCLYPKGSHFTWGPVPPRIRGPHGESTVKQWSLDLSRAESIVGMKEFNSISLEKGWEVMAAMNISLDTTNLFDAVDEPHFLPSVTPSLGPFQVMITRPLAVEIDPQRVTLLGENVCERRAFLIPFRGALPWPDVTPAVVVNSSPTISTPDLIFWTQKSICSFWSFLLELRSSDLASSIGLSFYAAPDTHHSSTVLYATRQGRSSDQDPLQDVDHVKIYHNASKSKFIRDTLKSWRSVLSNDARRTEDILQNAQFALLNDRNELVSC